MLEERVIFIADVIVTLPTKGTGLIEYVLQCAISVLQLPVCGVSCKYPFEIILSDIRETV